jgi:predicted transcriptional regulator of viral defense system
MNKKRQYLSEKDEFIMKWIEDNQISCFYFDNFILLEKFDRAELQDSLTRLVKRGFLFRIEKGLYCVRNFKNTNVIANMMLNDSIISYWSALNLHGLTEQIPNVVYSQSQYQKHDKTAFNVHYKFVKVKPEKMFGSMQMGYGSEAFRVTDVEKTLLDCFDLPQYSGGYAELIRAFYAAKINTTRLLEYGLKMNNLSVLKRMAFLSELFQMKGFTRFQKEILKLTNQKYSLIDPFGKNTGEFNAQWRVRLNISKESLLNIIHNIY